jgi:nicotinate phosphoribosyltransferase
MSNTKNNKKEVTMTSTAFLTDQYELTMLQAALQDGTAHRKATFELFARKLPKGRGYGVVAGTERALKAVKKFRFTEKQLAFLAKNDIVNADTIEYLRAYKFKGDIVGYREGDVFFPYSPIMTVHATFADAVLIETILLSIMNYDSAIASAASRMVQAAEGIPVFELGSRRAHEAAAVSATRAAYLVGFKATSNLEAGLKYGIPTMGTSAHAFTLAHADEKKAFASQISALGVGTTLLVDTYNIEQGIRNAVEIAGTELGGIRIDSGDLVEETLKARILLDSLGAVNTKIVLSSDIDEYIIADLVAKGCKVGGIGAGTKVVTGSGFPTSGMVYKLVEIEGENGEMIPVAKKAENKVSVGGTKTVTRLFYKGEFAGEIISVNKPEYTNNVTVTLMKNGKIVVKPTLDESAAYHTKVMTTFAAKYKALDIQDTPVPSSYEIGEK